MLDRKAYNVLKRVLAARMITYITFKSSSSSMVSTLVSNIISSPSAAIEGSSITMAYSLVLAVGRKKQASGEA